MQNNPQGNLSNSIPINEISLAVENDKEFPVPQSKNKSQPHYQKPRKVGRPQQQYLRILEGMPIPSNNEMRQISPEQLAQHNTLESAWLSLNGVVYDVTLYMDYHPGGLELLKGCGKECLQLFNKFHPWVNASYLLQKFRLGHLVGNTGPTAKYLNV